MSAAPPTIASTGPLLFFARYWLFHVISVDVSLALLYPSVALAIVGPAAGASGIGGATTGVISATAASGVAIWAASGDATTQARSASNCGRTLERIGMEDPG